jgi:hypothetical protein
LNVVFALLFAWPTVPGGNWVVGLNDFGVKFASAPKWLGSPPEAGSSTSYPVWSHAYYDGPGPNVCGAVRSWVAWAEAEDGAAINPKAIAVVTYVFSYKFTLWLF